MARLIAKAAFGFLFRTENISRVYRRQSGQCPQRDFRPGRAISGASCLPTRHLPIGGQPPAPGKAAGHRPVPRGVPENVRNADIQVRIRSLVGEVTVRVR